MMSMSVCVFCLSVCEHISGATRAIFTKFLCMLRMAVARSSSGRVTKSQGEGAILEFPSPLTVHCNAFAGKGIIRLPVTSYSRRDHSVVDAVAANGIDREGDDGSDLRLLLIFLRLTSLVVSPPVGCEVLQ